MHSNRVYFMVLKGYDEKVRIKRYSLWERLMRQQPKVHPIDCALTHGLIQQYKEISQKTNEITLEHDRILSEFKSTLMIRLNDFIREYTQIANGSPLCESPSDAVLQLQKQYNQMQNSRHYKTLFEPQIVRLLIDYFTRKKIIFDEPALTALFEQYIRKNRTQEQLREELSCQYNVDKIAANRIMGLLDTLTSPEINHRIMLAKLQVLKSGIYFYNPTQGSVFKNCLNQFIAQFSTAEFAKPVSLKKNLFAAYAKNTQNDGQESQFKEALHDMRQYYSDDKEVLLRINQYEQIITTQKTHDIALLSEKKIRNIALVEHAIAGIKKSSTIDNVLSYLYQLSCPTEWRSKQDFLSGLRSATILSRYDDNTIVTIRNHKRNLTNLQTHKKIREQVIQNKIAAIKGCVLTTIDEYEHLVTRYSFNIGGCTMYCHPLHGTKGMARAAQLKAEINQSGDTLNVDALQRVLRLTASTRKHSLATRLITKLMAHNSDLRQLASTCDANDTTMKVARVVNRSYWNSCFKDRSHGEVLTELNHCLQALATQVGVRLIRE